VYLAADTDAAAARPALGTTIMMPPTAIEPGRSALAQDPTGAMFLVLAPRAR
jgi:predicted enzyme related to lactoylglutathione lyase